MEEQQNEIHRNVSSLKNNEFKTNNKRQGGRPGEVGVVILLTATYTIYLQTEIDLMTSLGTFAIYCSRTVVCRE
jgi:hypothetical protein